MQIIVRFARFVRKKKYCFCFCWAWYYFRILDVQKPKLGFLPCYFTKNYHVFHGYTKHLYLTFQTSDLYLNRFCKNKLRFFFSQKSHVSRVPVLSRPTCINFWGGQNLVVNSSTDQTFILLNPPQNISPVLNSKPYYGVNFEHPKWLSFESFFDPPEVFGCNSSWNSSQPSWTTCNTSAGTWVRKTPSDRNWGIPVFQPPKWTQNACVLKDFSCFALVGCWKETFSSCVFL